MEKHIFDEKTGISYTLVGDYYIPDLILPEENRTRKFGIWGVRHKRYLIEHKKEVFTLMQMNGTLNDYLADINEQAETMFIQLIEDMAKAEGITEQLKAENQMLWVQKMNNVRNRAMEIVNHEMIII